MSGVTVARCVRCARCARVRSRDAVSRAVTSDVRAEPRALAEEREAAGEPRDGATRAIGAATREDRRPRSAGVAVPDGVANSSPISAGTVEPSVIASTPAALAASPAGSDSSTTITHRSGIALPFVVCIGPESIT